MKPNRVWVVEWKSEDGTYSPDYEIVAGTKKEAKRMLCEFDHKGWKFRVTPYEPVKRGHKK